MIYVASNKKVHQKVICLPFMTKEEVFNRTTLLTSRVIWLILRVENQAFVNCRPGFGY